MGSISGQVSQMLFSHYGVELDSPQGNQQAPAENPAEAQNPGGRSPDPGELPPRAALTELSRLMRNFACETYSTTDVDRLLVAGKDKSVPSLGKSDRKDLQKLAKKAADAFTAISKLTVQDILNGSGAAADLEGLFDRAAELQLRLGNKLRELAKSDKYRADKFCDFREMLDDISFKCDSRGSEIWTLFREVQDFGEKLKASKVGDNAKFHEATVGELVRGMAGTMHGNDKSLIFSTQIKSIEDRLAQFAGRATVSIADLSRLLSETEGLRKELGKPAVAQTMDADIHAALTAHLSSLRTKLNGCADRAMKENEIGLVRQLGEMNQLGKDIVALIAGHEADFPVLSKLMSMLSQLEGGKIKDYGILDEIPKCLKANSSSLQSEIKRFRALPSAPKLVESAAEQVHVGGFLVKIGYSKLNENIAMVKRTIEEMQERRLSWWDNELNRLKQLSGEDVVNAFRRNDGLSMVIEARVHGAKEGDIDSQLCDRNLVDEHKLGSGAANTVYQITYKMSDGSLKDYVFKPDLAGRIGLGTLTLGQCSTYVNTQQAVKLNMATCDVANLLGLGRLTVKNHATMHNGQYGLLMEKAPGTEAENAAKPENASKFKSLSVVGNLALDLNELRWLDIATGQGDRHDRNYLVDFGENGQTQKTTAIDNDTSFMPYMVGVGKYDVKHNAKRFAAFTAQLSTYCYRNHVDYDGIMDKLQKNGYVVDVKTATKEELCALRMAFGFQTLAIPQQMSRSLCEKLKSLTDELIEEFAKKLAQNVDGQGGVDATVQRLKDLKEIAQVYEQEGKVVEDEKWATDESVVKKEMACPALLVNENREGGEINITVNYLMSSTLSRDFGKVIPDAWK